MKTVIETERLILREMIPGDVDDMLRLHSDPEVQKYTGENIITSRKEIKEKIKLLRKQNYETHGFGRWVTILKEGMQFVGWAGVKYLPEFDEIDLGYRFLKEHWGKGIATEASKAILEYAFNDLNLNRIIAIAMLDNKASIRVIEKVGMQFYKYAPYEPGEEDVAWYYLGQPPIT
ncbi:MAG: GNAT family N-acetyltransferase [Bacteroidota bacterium]